MARKNEHYLGRWVRLRRTLRTKGGDEFPKDSRCRVALVDRGSLHLEMKNPVPLNIFGPRRLQIWHVDVDDVELLPGKQPRQSSEGEEDADGDES